MRMKLCIITLFVFVGCGDGTPDIVIPPVIDDHCEVPKQDCDAYHLCRQNPMAICFPPIQRLGCAACEG